MSKNLKDAKGAKSAKAYKKSDRASSSQKSQPAQKTQRVGSNVEKFIEHTPPPVTIASGSIIIETDERFVSRANQGGTGHTRQHKLSPGRAIKGLKIQNDAGDIIYLDGDAAGSSVKVWWNRNVATEQILVDGTSLTIEADVDLGAGVQIAHPPQPSGTPPVQRIRQYTHPSTNGRGIEKVEIVKNRTTVFSRSDRLQMVMIWDTTG